METEDRPSAPDSVSNITNIDFVAYFPVLRLFSAAVTLDLLSYYLLVVEPIHF